MKVVGWTIVVLLGAVLIAGLQSPRRIVVGCRRIVSSAVHSFSFTRSSDKDDYEKSFLANVPAKKSKGAMQKMASHEDFEDVFEDLDSVDDSDEDPGIEILKGNVRSPKEMNDKEWMFFDVARIHVKGGDGGDGCMAMRREYCVEYGGPSGGNGGHGGHVFLECDHNLNTLAGLRHKIHHKAHDGTNGRGDSRHGYKGEDTVIYVPPGSIVRDQSGALAGELNNHGDRMMVARGGKGGRGNEYFKTPRHNAPLFAEKGEVGCERWIGIELKLIADVGLVGVPNAGKSTLLAAVTNAKPKIADYPFTTVVPNLGICDLFPVESPPKTSSAISSSSSTASGSMVLADIPGLLEGAHLGIGLGIAFLRHIQRCK
jgi:GTP-binding protein